MASTNNPQNGKKDQKERTQSEFLESVHGNVWQDRSALTRARQASTQASRVDTAPRAHGLSKNSDWVKKRSTKRRTVQAIGWVDGPIDILIDQCAVEWGVSRSKAVARLIKLGAENKILSANSSLLAQVVRESVATECRRFFNRLTGILFRMYILLCQVLNLQKNQLARTGFQKKLTTEQLDKILAWSRKQARDDVVQGSGSEGSGLDEAIDHWLDLNQKHENETEGKAPPSN